MASALTTSVTELPESRVRLQVQVPAAEVESRIERKARQLGRELKLPGFRRGKVPAPLVVQRIGREAVLEEAVRDSLGHWYADAIEAAKLAPVGDPKIDLGELPAPGAALEFSVEIGVIPTARLGEYKGVQAGRREPVVEEQRIDAEVDGLRERLAKLDAVERPAESGDFVVIDYAGSIDGVKFDGGEGRDQLVELGSGNLIPGFEDGLLGAAAGETRTVELGFPEDYGNKELAGRPASFEITVKEVKHKQLPALDEDFATDAGFDTVEELREDIRGKLGELESQRVDGEFREAALDVVAALAQIETPAALIEAKATELFERTLHSLSHRGITRETYLRITGRTEQELLADMLPEAEQTLRREAVIAAVVQAEGITPSDEDVIEAITPVATREGVEPQKLFADLNGAGRLDDVREDLAARQAVELIAAEAKPIPLEQAQAREQLWTPEKSDEQADAAGAAGKLWTPDR
ncbi:MAG TPA: trigger factor [Solirubrobacteraceae bacterium]|nr:trigger factor [Solirubrobacteraceae bacterium]